MALDLAHDFPALACLDGQAARILAGTARAMEVPAGTVLFRDGAECANYVLVTRGSIRVFKLSEGGREIVLYRVENGQSCVLTTNCLLSTEAYGAEGIAETDISMIVIPASTFRQLLAASEVFRDFVFSAYATRISDLLMLIEEVAFGRVDVRLAGWLAARADDQDRVKATHQDMAVELGTAREVVSRQLKEFERRGWLRLQRGAVQLLDRAALAAVCDR